MAVDAGCSSMVVRPGVNMKLEPWVMDVQPRTEMQSVHTDVVNSGKVEVV